MAAKRKYITYETWRRKRKGAKAKKNAATSSTGPASAKKTPVRKTGASSIKKKPKSVSRENHMTRHIKSPKGKAVMPGDTDIVGDALDPVDLSQPVAMETWGLISPLTISTFKHIMETSVKESLSKCKGKSRQMAERTLKDLITEVCETLSKERGPPPTTDNTQTARKCCETTERRL